MDLKPWDQSVKALTAFPSVLGNMDKNLSWTSSLGDAYYNEQENVLDAIQVMRERANEAGNLKTTPQETVATEDSTISIEPASSDMVYVPQYDPWLAYGNPVDAWPDWYPYPGIWYDGAGCWFGPAFPIGFFDGFDWGFRRWGFDRRHRFVTHNDNRYYSRSTTFYNRGAYYRTGSRVAAANSAARGLNARANGATMPSNRSAGERALVVPEDLRGNFEEKRPSIATPNEQRGVYNRPGATINPFGGNIAGGSRIRCSTWSERHPLRRLQRLRTWRPSQKLFGARRREFQWRRVARRRRRIARRRRASMIKKM